MKRRVKSESGFFGFGNDVIFYFYLLMQRKLGPRKSWNAWTAEEDEALQRGMKEHGVMKHSWDEIHKSEIKVLGHRTVKALERMYRAIVPKNLRR